MAKKMTGAPLPAPSKMKMAAKAKAPAMKSMPKKGMKKGAY